MAPDPAPAPETAPVFQRVRVGALGLACVFLLVMLATALLRAADTGRANQATAVAANGVTPDEPLATLGVAPGNVPPAPAPTHQTAGRAPR